MTKSNLWLCQAKFYSDDLKEKANFFPEAIHDTEAQTLSA